MSNIMELIEAYAHNYYGEPLEDEYNQARTAVLEAVEKLERDAARYRWLRNYLPSDYTLCYEALVAALTPEVLDDAIDAAMKEATNGQCN